MKLSFSWFRPFFWRQKYRFDLGYQFMTFVNFILLVVVTAKSLGFQALPVLILAIPLAFVGVWCWGYFLDRVMNAQQTNEKIWFDRSPINKEHIRKTEEIHKAIIK
jgi:hypothetical protein